MHPASASAAHRSNPAPLKRGQLPALLRQPLRLLLRPGVRLMQRLRLQAKLALVSTACIVPLVAMMSLQVAHLLEKRNDVVRARQGVEVHTAMAPLLAQVQMLRSLNHLVLAGDASSVAQRDAARADLQRGLLALDTPLRQHGYAAEPAWLQARERTLALTQAQQPGMATAAFKTHTQAIDALQGFLLVNAHHTGLLEDAAAASHHPVEMLVNLLAQSSERLAQTQGLGLAVLQHGAASDRERADLQAMATLVEQAGADLQSAMQAWQRAGGQPPVLWQQTQGQLFDFVLTVRDTFSASVVSGHPKAYLQASTRVTEQFDRIRDDTAGLLSLLYRQQQQQLESELLQVALTFAAGLAALGYLLTCFAVNFQGSVRGLRRATDAIANGDLSHRAQVYGRDELADIGGVMDRMAQQLSTMVAEIRNSAALVNTTGQQVSSGSAKLALRTDDQAGSLRSSISAINQLAADVASNAEAARQLDGLTERLTAQADEGNTAMQDTVLAVERMRVASGRVAEVVSVIDDVAFQTGMLSLNAAVEAARAGEAGKGFAVVASEVRQLAQRCGESAEEIRKLIGDAGAQVDASSQKIGHVSAALGSIVAGVREVSQQLRGMSQSSAEQSAGLAAVTTSVGNLDEITRDNAALVEESSTASNALVERADLLRQAVSTMQLRQGSAEESLALVKKAAAHFNAVGQAQAMKDFHDPAGGFIDRDLYIFAIDRHGHYAAVGNNPDRVGQSFSTVPGLDKDYLDRVWAAADSGGGWVSYQVLNPATQVVTPKESFVTACGPDLAIGCGIYRTDLGRQRPDKPRAAAWSTRSERPQQPVNA